MDKMKQLERPIEQLAFDVKGAALATGFCLDSIYRFIKDGKIKVARYGRHIVISRDALQDFIDRLYEEQHNA